MRTANTIEDLAELCGVDRSVLRATVDRFNAAARRGVDDDFGRGVGAYNRICGDPTVGPNANLGALEQPPFFAVNLYPGDVGTNGGLLTDEHARVLATSGEPIVGLYAVGNCSASVMGRSYTGGGASIGPAMTFGYIAAEHALAR